MYKVCSNLFLLILLISCSDQGSSEYPESKKEKFTEIIHGYEISDSYRWLEDFTSEESLNWVKEQNKFTNKFIGKSEAETALAPKTTTFLLLIFICFSTLIPYSFNVCRYAKTSSTC